MLVIEIFDSNRMLKNVLSPVRMELPASPVTFFPLDKGKPIGYYGGMMTVLSGRDADQVPWRLWVRNDNVSKAVNILKIKDWKTPFSFAKAVNILKLG
jgi:hypothetical protein